MIISAFAIAAAIGVAPPPADDSDMRGTAGICIRWGSDPNRVAEAVVVVSSGNPTLDRSLPESIRNMNWPRPASPPYHGEWIGIVMQIAGSSVQMPPPKCDGLSKPQPDRT